MPNYSKPRHIWRSVYPVLIFLGILFFVSFAAIVGYGVHQGIQLTVSGEALDLETTTELTDAFISEYGILFQLIANAMLITLFALMWRKIRTRITPYSNNKLSPLPVMLIVLFSIGLNYILTSIFAITDLPRFFPTYEDISKALMSGNLLLRILGIGIAAPIAEELCIRGVVFNRLNAWLPLWAAVIISSALFGIMHLNLFQGLYTTLVGVVFCLLYVRYRNLWIPIVGHIAFNMSSIILDEVMSSLGVEDLNAWLLLLSSLVVAGVCIVIMIKRTQAAILSVEQKENNDCSEAIAPMS